MILWEDFVLSRTSLEPFYGTFFIRESCKESPQMDLVHAFVLPCTALGYLINRLNWPCDRLLTNGMAVTVGTGIYVSKMKLCWLEIIV